MQKKKKKKKKQRAKTLLSLSIQSTCDRFPFSMTFFPFRYTLEETLNREKAHSFCFFCFDFLSSVFPSKKVSRDVLFPSLSSTKKKKVINTPTQYFFFLFSILTPRLQSCFSLARQHRAMKVRPLLASPVGAEAAPLILGQRHLIVNAAEGSVE